VPDSLVTFVPEEGEFGGIEWIESSEGIELQKPATGKDYRHSAN
jgi:hypothetical protein